MLIALFILAAVVLDDCNTQPQKLINMKTGRAVVEFFSGRAIFHDRFLEEEMRQVGICIPSHMLEMFDGKSVIYLTDPLFEKAFIEVYTPFYIENALFQWQNYPQES